ncbi:MAG: glycosyltransferase, partial [Vicinamibacterales bacterium]
VHTGYLHTELGCRNAVAGLGRHLLGGGVPGVNILTRSHVYLLEAIDRVVAGNPALASQIELHLAGILSSSDVDASAGSTVVRTHGYLPHGETVNLVRCANLLFLPMHDLPAGKRATIVPGKTYEYLASGRPILAALPDGDARDLLTRAGTAFVCRPDDVSSMAEVIAGQVERVRTGGPAPLLRHGVLAPYERRNLTEQLARVFDAVVDGRAGATRDRALQADVAG